MDAQDRPSFGSVRVPQSAAAGGTNAVIVVLTSLER
jgi:hypothetical protein